MKKAIICFVVLCCLGLAAFQYSNYAASIYGSLTANHCIKAGPGSNQIQDSGSACASGGTGNVTNSGTLTSTAIVTGAGTTVVQAPSANSTLDSSGNVSFAGTLAALGHVTLEGVTSTGATGTGKLVYDTSPTLATPTIGVATATSVNKVAITAPASSATLTIADGTTLSSSATQMLNLTEMSGDFTTSGVGTALEAATGWSFVLPASTARTYRYQCYFWYIQNTGNASIQFGISYSQAPTASTQSCEWNNLNTVVPGTFSTTSTSATQVCTAATPTDTTTIRGGRVFGFIVNPSTSASTVQFYAKTATAGDTVTVKAHTYCEVQ